MKKERKFSFKGKVIASAEKQKKAGSSYGYLLLQKGIKMFTLDEGTKSVDLDFLPYIVTDSHHPEHDVDMGVALPDTPWYRRPYKVHRNIGANKTSVVCPTSIGKKCPICEFQNKRFKENADKEELTALRAKSRSLYVVIPIGDKKHPEEIHVWDMSDALFQNTLLEVLQENEEFEDFFDLENGRTATVRLRWESLGGNTYPEARDIDFGDVRDPYDEAILDDVPKLDEMLKILSYEELYALLWDEEDAGELKTVETDTEHIRERRRPTPEIEEKPTRPQRERREVAKDEVPIPSRRKPVEKEKEQEEEKKEIVPKRGTSSAGKSKEIECPHGHTFGVDTDDFKECDKCDIWNECIDVKEKR
jgi:hypothetical protein